MILREHGRQVLACNTCEEGDEELTTESQTFLAMIDLARSRRWLIRADGSGGWEHFCPDCRPDSLADHRKLLGL